MTALGLLPPFDPSRLAAMGQYTDPAAGQPDYRRPRIHQHAELSAARGARHGRVSSSTPGRTSHVLKAGIGYEFAEETLNRLANGWGIIAPVTVSGVPALRARYFTPQPAQIGQGDTYSLFVQDSLTLSNRLSVNAGVLLTRDAVRAACGRQRRLPRHRHAAAAAPAVYESKDDTLHLPALRLRRRDPAAGRRQLPAAERQGGQGLRRLGPLLQHGPEIERPQPRPQPHLPDADLLRPERRPCSRAGRSPRPPAS